MCIVAIKNKINKKRACGIMKDDENTNMNNNKRHARGVCEWVDENNNINNNKRHARGVCE